MVKNVEVRMVKKVMRSPRRSKTPMSSDYTPELYATTELESYIITMYQELIGVLRWAIDIGRVYIEHEFSVLSSYRAAPRDGPLQHILHIFAFLKKNPKLTLYLNPTPALIDPTPFTGITEEYFRDQYIGAREELPIDAPKARARAVEVTTFVNASHASDKNTRLSQTGYIVFVNCAPIIWYIKKQATVDSSTFGSEFIALKTCV